MRKMNGGKPHKTSKRDSESSDDKFTSLPCDLIDLILSSLPIKDAIRTSVLSSKWRFKWTTMPNLVFDQHCFSSPTPQDQNIVHMIDCALILHNGPVSKFMLYQRDPITPIDIDRWILYLSTCLVQEFILEIWEGGRYKLHYFLFSFQHLVNLELYRCTLEFLPSNFRGFKKLKSLDLQNLTMTQDAFKTLISSCPVLEKLNLFKVDGFTHLNIFAPNLLDIYFEGYFDDINFVNTSNLETVIIAFINPTKRIKAAQGFNNLLNFCSNLPRIRQLRILGNFLEYLANGKIPLQLPNPCRDLGCLEIDIFIDGYAECSAALCLLRSSPNIQQLEITVKLSSEEMDYTFWQSKHNSCSLNKLEIVKISGICGSRYELEFIKFMLLASPLLKKMRIKPTCSENQAVQQLARELESFQPTLTKYDIFINITKL